ncbi:aminotransferase class V-fold PLP-dependent enzyme [Microbacterium keratanolyticum]
MDRGEGRIMDERARRLHTVLGDSGRSVFALDPAVRHINHGSYGASPRVTLEYQAQLKAALDANPMRWFETLPPRHAAVRDELAQFLRVPSSTLAWVPNASAASTVVFSSLELDAGDEVIVTDHAYGAVAQGVTRLVERRGAHVVTVGVPLSAGEEQTRALILDAVTPRTRVVMLDQISSATARRFPVDAVADALADTGILLVIDGAHGLGLLEDPVVSGDHVVWFGNLHKYACGPRGAAVLAARGDVAQRLWPAIDSWGAAEPFPQRFDLQGSLDSTAFLSAAHAIRTMATAFGGWSPIREHSAVLGRYGADLLITALGPISDDDPAIDVGMPVAQQPLVRLPRGAAHDGRSARSLKDAFAEDGFEVGVSTFGGRGYVRISAHAYSEAEDFEAFAERAPRIIADTVAAHSPAR